MGNKDISILVVGAGAVGGITAAILKKDGYNVEIVCRNEEYASLIRSEGLQISGVCGNFSITLPAYSNVSEISKNKDLIVHATKATDMIEAAKAVKSLLKDDGHVVSLQNGICEDALASVLGKDKVIGCVTGWGATMESPGKLIMTSTGDFILGYPDRNQDEYLSAVAEILSSVVPVRLTDNIMGHLYSKLIINACISSLGVLCGLYLGEMLGKRKIRNIFIEIIREAVLVSGKMGINIEVFGGRLDFRKFLEGDNFIADFRRHMFIRVIGFKYRKLKSSSLQSVLRGKQTEVEYLNGYIVRNANLLGIYVPVNAEINKMVHEIEAGTRKITMDNFNNPVFDRFND